MHICGLCSVVSRGVFPQDGETRDDGLEVDNTVDLQNGCACCTMRCVLAIIAVCLWLVASVVIPRLATVKN
jgi:hypothetical protein